MTPNKILAAALAVFIVASGTLFGLWRYEALAHADTKKDLATAKLSIEDHVKNIAIAERTNHEYQADIDRLGADVKRLRKRPAKCVPVATTPGVRPEQGPGREYGAKDGGSSGIHSEWLYDYAIEAETLRIERNACKDFVNRVWESKE